MIFMCIGTLSPFFLFFPPSSPSSPPPPPLPASCVLQLMWKPTFLSLGSGGSRASTGQWGQTGDACGGILIIVGGKAQPAALKVCVVCCKASIKVIYFLSVL